MGDDPDEDNGLAGWRRYRAGVKPMQRQAVRKPVAVKRLSPAISTAPEPLSSPRAADTVAAGKKTWRRLAEVAPPSKTAGMSRWQPDDQILAIDDPQWRRRLQAGDVKPEARLDLHHHGAATAHHAVVAFIAEAQQRGQRILLIITGSGDVLRPSLPRWLQAPPLKASIRWIFPASPAHGGQGAYYVVLRRHKSNGK